MRWLAAIVAASCGPATPQPAPVRTTPTWGTAHPYAIVAIPPDASWAVICQARADTDGNGVISIEYGMHGDQQGDAMVAYLIDPSGKETVVDNYLAKDPTGRWLVVVEAGRPVLIDTRSWVRTPLDGMLPQFKIVHGRTYWEIDPTGTRLLYARGWAPIVRELATGRETQIAPAAWSATWSVDGAWVELEVLRGDTNGDGIIRGPSRMPIEGIPGHECGHKFDWDHAHDGLVPAGADAATESRAFEAQDDGLVRSLWRVDDGLVVATGERAIDRDTTVIRDRGGLAVTAIGGVPRALPSGCEVNVVYPPARSLALGCELPGERFFAQWWQLGRGIELYRGDTRAGLYPAGGGGYASLSTEELGSVIDMRSGAVLARGPRLGLHWGDDGRMIVGVWHRSLELRWRDGRRPPVALVADADVVGSAGRYVATTKQRTDLETGASVALPEPPVAVRDDGAVLVDGGPEHTLEAIDHPPHVGPLRWVQP